MQYQLMIMEILLVVVVKKEKLDLQMNYFVKRKKSFYLRLKFLVYSVKMMIN